jgi:hypothetical protein
VSTSCGSLLTLLAFLRPSSHVSLAGLGSKQQRNRHSTHRLVSRAVHSRLPPIDRGRIVVFFADQCLILLFRRRFVFLMPLLCLLSAFCSPALLVSSSHRLFFLCCRHHRPAHKQVPNLDGRAEDCVPLRARDLLRMRGHGCRGVQLPVRREHIQEGRGIDERSCCDDAFVLFGGIRLSARAQFVACAAPAPTQPAAAALAIVGIRCPSIFTRMGGP